MSEVPLHPRNQGKTCPLAFCAEASLSSTERPFGAQVLTVGIPETLGEVFSWQTLSGIWRG